MVGSEEKLAMSGLKLAITVVKFVHENRAIMGRSRVSMYNSSVILRNIEGCISSKMNPRSNPLTKKRVFAYLSKAEDALGSFPKSYHVLLPSGVKQGEAIFNELQICKDIIGEHYGDMLQQDFRNRYARANASSTSPSAFRTSCHMVPAKM